MCVCVCVCVCVCAVRPPVRVVCQNYEVVVFQPWTGTATDLGSVATTTNFILVSSLPTCFNRFLDLSLFTSTILRPPHQSPFFVKVSLSVAPDPPPSPKFYAQNDCPHG